MSNGKKEQRQDSTRGAKSNPSKVPSKPPPPPPQRPKKT